MTKEEIDAKYLAQANALEAEFFDIVDQGLPSQHRVLKAGKTIEDFTLQHGQIWKNHEAELIANGYMEPPPEPTPPLCTHWARIAEINLETEKPVRVKRTWNGKEYQVNCYVTENIKDQYLAGDIVVGDFVLVQFLEDSADRAVVFAKVFKTW